ncbi:MAG: helix-turn-helix domain-containing protein [Acidimicrobiia bacterium]
MESVNRRSYDSSRRKEQAEQTRLEIIEVARRQFLDEGFAATTIGAIASEVGVSVDTIYKTFGGKAGVLRAVYERGLAGQGAVPAEIRSDALQTTEPDTRTVYAGLGRLSTEVAPRAGPILLLIEQAATTDSEMADLLAELESQRLTRMTHVAENLRCAGHLRTDITVEAAAEVMWLYTAPRIYELLVIKRGWPLERFGTFIGETLTAALAPPG